MSILNNKMKKKDIEIKEWQSGPHCPNSKDHKHLPDYENVTADSDGEIIYLVVKCKNCGLNGFIGIKHSLEDSITW